MRTPAAEALGNGGIVATINVVLVDGLHGEEEDNTLLASEEAMISTPDELLALGQHWSDLIVDTYLFKSR